MREIPKHKRMQPWHKPDAHWTTWPCEEITVEVDVENGPTGTQYVRAEDALKRARARLQRLHPECEIFGTLKDLMDPDCLQESYRKYKIYRARFRIYTPPIK